MRFVLCVLFQKMVDRTDELTAYSKPAYSRTAFSRLAAILCFKIKHFNINDNDDIVASINQLKQHQCVTRSEQLHRDIIVATLLKRLRDQLEIFRVAEQKRMDRLVRLHRLYGPTMAIPP